MLVIWVRRVPRASDAWIQRVQDSLHTAYGRGLCYAQHQRRRVRVLRFVNCVLVDHFNSGLFFSVSTGRSGMMEEG